MEQAALMFPAVSNVTAHTFRNSAHYFLSLLPEDSSLDK
jgi:hypothetical protein